MGRLAHAGRRPAGGAACAGHGVGHLVFAPTPEGEVVPDQAVGTVAWRFIGNGPTSVVDAVITFPDLVLHLWFKVVAPGANFPIYQLDGEYTGAVLDDAGFMELRTGGRVVLDHQRFAEGWDFPLLAGFQNIEDLIAAEAVSLVFSLPDGATQDDATVSFLFGDTGRAAFAAAIAAWGAGRP